MNLPSSSIDSPGSKQRIRWQIEIEPPATRRSPHRQVDTHKEVARRTSQAQTRQIVTDLIGEHQIGAANSLWEYTFEIQHLSTGNFQLVDLQWQAAFRLTQTTRSDRYLIYLVSAGHLAHTISAHQTYWCSPTTATIIDPGQKLEIASSQKGKALLISIDRDAIDLAMSKLLASGALKGNRLKQPVIFSPSIDLTSELGLSLKNFLQFLWDSNRAAPTASAPLVMQKLEQAFLACAIEGLPNNYTEELLYQADGALACHVRKASAFIESHLHEDIKLADIASATSVCSRLLQKAFAHHCGCSPMRFVTQLRLQRIRQELEVATSDTKIVDVMMNYGFTQGGKFAKEYQQLFGEKPSETLRRCSQLNTGSSLWQQLDDPHSEEVAGGVNVATCRLATLDRSGSSGLLAGLHRWWLPGFRAEVC